MACMKGGNVINRHDEIKQTFQDLLSKALKPSCVRDEPQIHLSSARSTASPADATPSLTPFAPTDERSNILARGFHHVGKDTIFDVQVTHLDSKSYVSRTPENVLKWHEKDKKSKYLYACADQRSESSVAASVFGELGLRPDSATAVCLSRALPCG